MCFSYFFQIESLTLNKITSFSCKKEKDIKLLAMFQEQSLIPNGLIIDIAHCRSLEKKNIYILC